MKPDGEGAGTSGAQTAQLTGRRRNAYVLPEVHQAFHGASLGGLQMVRQIFHTTFSPCFLKTP